MCGTDLNTNWDGYAIKIDSLGNSEWQKLYPAIFFKGIFAVQEAFDGGYIFAGRINDNLQTDFTRAYLLKTDTLGNQLWDKRYLMDSLITTGHSLLKLKNGYLISGTNGDPFNGIRMCFFRTDINGNLQFSKKIETGSIRDEYYYYTAIKSQNKYIFCFERDTIPQSVAGAVITDSNGNVIISKILNYPNTFRYAATKSTLIYPNGDIVFGCTSAFPNTSYDIYLIRTDSNLYSPPYIGIVVNTNQQPVIYKLNQNYPNPFNPKTTITFDLPKDIDVRLTVYDVLGREIYSINEFRKSGSNKITFDGSNLASGVYYYSLETGTFAETRKMVLIK